MSAPEPTANFYPTAEFRLPVAMNARTFGVHSALLIRLTDGRIKMRPHEVRTSLELLIQSGDALLAANCGCLIYDALESLTVTTGPEADMIRAALPAAWHTFYSANRPHIAGSRGYRE